MNDSFVLRYIDDYIELWNENLLGSEGVHDLMNALIAKYLGEE